MNFIINREAIINITVSNMDRSMIRNWRVSDGCSFYDHQLISFSINLSSGFHNSFRNPGRNDSKFEEAVEEKLRALKGHSTHGINDRVGSLTNIMLSCYRDICLLIYSGKRSQPAWCKVKL